jgi:hypothetical protein
MDGRWQVFYPYSQFSLQPKPRRPPEFSVFAAGKKKSRVEGLGFVDFVSI